MNILVCINILISDAIVSELSERFLQFRFANSPEYAAKFRYPVNVEEENFQVTKLGDDQDAYMIVSRYI